MKFKTCFVIMPIGDQEFGNAKLTAADLKKRYDDLIKEAILKADPSLEVMRADEVSFPGSITSDVITRIMHSDIVVADVTYPNPNVFYELGLRHACRVGTVIIRDKSGPSIPLISYTSDTSITKTIQQGSRHWRVNFETTLTILRRIQNLLIASF